MSILRHTLALACLAGAALAPVHAGEVKVSFVDADAYADAGATAPAREANLAALAAHLDGLGRRLLADDMVLDVALLDVDLAGSLRPSRRGDLRIARGGADWPRITLRYSLAKGGQVQQSGTERISDMHYLMHGTQPRFDALGHERRMLDDWFRARFVDPVAAAR